MRGDDSAAADLRAAIVDAVRGLPDPPRDGAEEVADAVLRLLRVRGVLAGPVVGEPTAAVPWLVTLCWTPAQNHGRVSVWPGRAPVWSVWGLLAAGEDPDRVAAEHGLDLREVRVLDVLRRDAADHLAPDDSGSETRVLTLCTHPGRDGGAVTVGDSRLRAAPVVRLMGEYGAADVAVRWPQLTVDEVAVLGRLARDLEQAERDQAEVVRGAAIEVLRALVQLKDGPRDAAYGAAWDAAWNLAREVLSGARPRTADPDEL